MTLRDIPDLTPGPLLRPGHTIGSHATPSPAPATSQAAEPPKVNLKGATDQVRKEGRIKWECRFRHTHRADMGCDRALASVSQTRTHAAPLAPTIIGISSHFYTPTAEPEAREMSGPTWEVGSVGTTKGALRRDPPPAGGTFPGSRKPLETPEGDSSTDSGCRGQGTGLCHARCPVPLTDMAWRGKVTLFRNFSRNQK